MNYLTLLFMAIATIAIASTESLLKVGDVEQTGKMNVISKEAASEIKENGTQLTVKDLILREACFVGDPKEVSNQILDRAIEYRGDESCKVRAEVSPMGNIRYLGCKMDYVTYSVGIYAVTQGDRRTCNHIRNSLSRIRPRGMGLEGNRLYALSYPTASRPAVGVSFDFRSTCLHKIVLDPNGY